MKHMRMIQSLRYLIVIAFLFCVKDAATQVQTPRHISMTSNTNGFYEYLPIGYEAGNKTYPLIIFVHGMGELGDGSPAQLPRLLFTGLAASINVGELPVTLTVNGETHSFIVISPQFVSWPSAADIDAVINYATRNYRVNTSRIYLTGLSMGGGVAWEYTGASSANASRIAAIVPICGASWPDYTRARNIANANVAVWALHNRYDPQVPVWYTESYVSQINEAPAPNPRAKHSIFEAYSHDAWTATYNSTNRDETGKTIYEWMLQFKKGGTAPPSNNQAPTANAGPDQSISLPTSSVQLNGSGTDPDGTISSYSWRRISGPGSPTFNNANIANPVVSNLIAGTHTFRLTVTDNGNATAFDDVVINVRAAIPGKIEAEGYTAMNGIQTENTSDVGGGQNVGWIDNGDWMDYNDINVNASGNYTVNFRVASPNTGARFELRNGSGAVLTTVTVPNTGGYQVWQSVSAQVNLTAGTQNLRIYCVTANGGWNINWMDFVQATTSPAPAPTPSPSPAPSTSKIEAEAYTGMSGIQTEPTSDVGGGLNIGWQDTGDWMDYSVNVSTAGTYTVNFRVATMFNGPQFQLRNSSGSVLATVNVPNTGSFQAWQTVSAQVNLPAGQQTLRIHTSNAAGGWNFNWFEIAGNGTATNSVNTATETNASIGEMGGQGSMEVSPNPVQDRFTLTVDNPFTGAMKVEVVSLAGAVVKTFQLQKTTEGPAQFYLSIGEIANGNYFIKVTMQGWSNSTQIVKE
jgi:endoglucanase